MTNPIVCTDLSDDEYHSGVWLPEPSLSVSGAKRILDCPARFKWEQENPPRKKAYDFGHAAHAKVLGVGLTIVTVPVELLASNGAVSTKAAKEWVAEQEAAGAVVLRQAEVDVIDAMAKELENSDEAMDLFRDGTPEQSIAWRDDATKVMLRARLDWTTVYHDVPLIVDYKTTGDANPDRFRWEAGKYGYHMQDAWYREGMEALTGRPHGFVFVAQEKEPPHLVSVVELDDDAREIGSQRNTVARRLYLDCMTRDHWPAYPGIHRISIPNARPAQETTHV